jgi:heat shock protein HtpX
VGSFISLLLSRIMAKWTMGVRIVFPATAYGPERDLLESVHRLSVQAGLPTMPEVGIYESAELNAFATGPTKSRALVAVSSGLLSRMTRDELEGVLAHEIAHIANGDMVTLTLIQGVVNAFVLFFAKIIAFFAALFVKEESRPMAEFAITLLAQIILGILGSMIVSAFSRWREFRADSGAAALGGRLKMIAALERLQRGTDLEVEAGHPSLAAFKISGSKGGMLALLSTHPPLEDRIARLRQSS